LRLQQALRLVGQAQALLYQDMQAQMAQLALLVAQA
jgi:hypothetical protein